MILWSLSSALTQDLKSNPIDNYYNSIQFGITDKFTLGTFEGSIISYKRHLSEQNAIRIGFGASINLETTSHNNYYPSKDTIDYIYDRELNYNKYEMSIQFLRFSEINNNMRFYYGIGPIVTKSTGSSKSNRTYYDYQPDTVRYSISENDYTSKGFGLVGTFGFEWKFNQSIRFIAEYGATYIEGKSEDFSESKYLSSNNTRYEVFKTKYTRLEPRFVNFGLSFYF